jgi:hypothetical protein
LAVSSSLQALKRRELPDPPTDGLRLGSELDLRSEVQREKFACFATSSAEQMSGGSKTDKRLKAEAERALSSLAPQVEAILASYGVPVVWEMQTDP